MHAAWLTAPKIAQATSIRHQNSSQKEPKHAQQVPNHTTPSANNSHCTASTSDLARATLHVATCVTDISSCPDGSVYSLLPGLWFFLFYHISNPNHYESLRHSPTVLGYPTNIPTPTKFNTLIMHYVSNYIYFYNCGVGGMRRQPLNIHAVE